MEYPARKTLDDKEMFEEVVQAILSVMGDDALKIILYGSVARGDNTWESDIDIAVLSKREYDWQEEDKLVLTLSPAGLKYDTIFSVIIIEENDFNKWWQDFPFYGNINKDGIVLWNKKAA